MSQPDPTPAPPERPPGDGPRYPTLIDQMAAWAQERRAATALEK